MAKFSERPTMTQKFKDPPWHPGINWTNTNHEFLPTDTEQSFKKLCQDPECLAYFQKQGWLEPGAITYKINSHGFRCDEFDDQDCIVALGCSFTIGIGLPVESTWPQLVSKSLGLATRTLAWGGTSADTCFRLAEYWIPQLKPKAVFMLTPPPARFEVIRALDSPPIEVYLPQSESNSASEIDSFLRHWFTMDENSRLNHKKNKLAIQAMCAQAGIPCLIYDAFDYMAKSREDVGYARDKMHAGPDGHAFLAERMLNDWNKKYA
jgi:hypothetical protein